jgi:Xaa-Pro aminopeptidase
MSGADKRYVLEELRPESEVPFSPAEYGGRLARLRAAMAEAGLDVLFLSSPESLYYLSGFRAEWYQAFGPKAWLPASGIAVHVDRDDYIHFEVENEQVLAGFTSVSRDLRILGEGSQPMDSLLEFIVDELQAEGWLGGRVGLEMWSYRPSRGYSERFQAALEAKGAAVVDGSDVAAAVRKLKSPQEIAYTREAARIGDVGFKAALDFIRPGVSELDVYGEMVNAMAKAGGENPSITPPVSSGAKSACMHALASRKKIMRGDIVNIDLCGVYNRYHANMARSISIGEPHPVVARRLEVITGAKAFVAGLMRPGLPVADLLAGIEGYYREGGIWDEQCWIGGYDLGASFPPDWVGPWYYDVHTDPGDETFAPGTVCNYEANFYLPGRAGMSMFIDTLAIEDAAAAFLHRTPAQLFVVA